MELPMSPAHLFAGGRAEELDKFSHPHYNSIWILFCLCKIRSWFCCLAKKDLFLYSSKDKAVLSCHCIVLLQNSASRLSGLSLFFKLWGLLKVRSGNGEAYRRKSLLSPYPSLLQLGTSVEHDTFPLDIRFSLLGDFHPMWSAQRQWRIWLLLLYVSLSFQVNTGAHVAVYNIIVFLNDYTALCAHHSPAKMLVLIMISCSRSHAG